MAENTKQIVEKFALAVKHHQAGNLPVSTSLYREILSIQPDHVPSIGNLAIIAKKLGNYDLSINLLRQLIQLNPEDSNTYNTLGNLYYEKDQIVYGTTKIQLNDTL